MRVYPTRGSSVHLSVKDLGCLHLVAINSTIIMNVVNINVRISAGISTFSSLGSINLGVELLDHMIILCLTFEEPLAVSMATAQIHIPVVTHRVPVSLHTCQSLHFPIFDYTHPGGWELIPHFGLGLHFTENLFMSHLSFGGEINHYENIRISLKS